MKSLLKKGYQVVVSSPHGPKIEKLKEMGIIHKNIEFDRHGKNIKDQLKLIRNYKNLIKEVKPKVILTFTIKPNIYGASLAKAKKIPYIINVTGLGTAFQKEGLTKNILTVLLKFVFSDAQKIFFQNQANLQYFTDQNIYSKNYCLLPGSGVNLDEFSLVPFPQKGPINFIFIGRIMKEKGIDEYIELAKYIKEKYKNVNFYVCGFVEDRMYHNLIDSLNKQEIICYLGNVSNIKETIKKMHCIIHPSYHEGMSNVLLEAAACGRPAIASNIPGCKEIVRDDISGYLFEKKNMEQLKGSVEEFLNLTNEQRERMGQNARKHVELHFDRNIIVRSYLEEIEKL